MNAIYQLLNPDNTISLNRPLAHAVGLMETVVYSALIAKWQYYSDRGKLDPDGWFYSTIADLEESTSLSDKQQKRCITVLEKRGLIKCSPRGMPAKRSFYIIDDIVHLAEILAEGEEKMRSVKPSAAEKYKRNSTTDEENSTPEKEETPPQTALLHCSAERAKQETPKGRNKERPNGEARNAETAEQETPKRQNMIRPNGGPCYAQTADKSKDNNLKENNPDIINPINQSGGTDEMEYITRIKEERSAYAQIVRDNTDYEFLIEQNPGKADTINELISIMVDAICSTRPTIRVNGEDVPHDVVKSTFLKLNGSHIEYVLEAMDNNTSDVRNIRSYLITALYNSRLTLNSYWQSRVTHDMKEYWQEG